MNLDVVVNGLGVRSAKASPIETGAILLLRALALPVLLLGLVVWVATATTVAVVQGLVSLRRAQSRALTAFGQGNGRNHVEEPPVARSAWPAG